MRDGDLFAVLSAESRRMESGAVDFSSLCDATMIAAQEYAAEVDRQRRLREEDAKAKEGR